MIWLQKVCKWKFLKDHYWAIDGPSVVISGSGSTEANVIRCKASNSKKGDVNDQHKRKCIIRNLMYSLS